MKRREFFIRVGGAMLAVPAVLHVAGCGGDDDDDDDVANPDAAGGMTSFEGTGSGSHSHTFTVQCTDLSSNSDVTYTSSATDHSHQLTLTVAQLGMLAAGSTVTFTTNDGHTHNWTIAKPNNAC